MLLPGSGVLNRATTHVDHVIPWSHLPLNDIANLVLSDEKCNGDKSARLISSGTAGEVGVSAIRRRRPDHRSTLTGPTTQSEPSESPTVLIVGIRMDSLSGVDSGDLVTMTRQSRHVRWHLEPQLAAPAE